MSLIRRSSAQQTVPANKTVRDRRHHRRVKLSVDGRFMNESSEDHGLITTDVSCSGALFKSAFKPAVGDRVICYLDGLGRVDAKVVRATAEGFAAQFNTTSHKRDKLADQLIWLVNKVPLGLHEERGSKRYARTGAAIVTREDGRKMQCRVVDISLTGAGFETDGPVPLVGEVITAGNLRGEVMRAARGSFGVRFVRGAKIDALAVTPKA